MTPKRTILLAAGGTGGHLYPAEALAEELLVRGHAVVIVTDKRGDAFKRLGDRVRVIPIRAATFKAGIVSKIKAVIDIMLGILQSAVLLKKFRPALVVGFGGYPSFPPVFAAQQMGFATLIHEQNAVLGKANLHLANRARAIAASWPGTKGIAPANAGKVTITGNPVRAAICAVREIMPTDGTFNLFITGGSTALTRVFNENVPAALKLLPDTVRQRIRAAHQCRAEETAATAARYSDAGVEAEIKPFFDDMPARLSSCHLFIGRSGASTVTELAVVGRPAVFVPYPGHADRQQTHNATPMAQAGGAWIIQQEDFSPQALAAHIERLATDAAAWKQAAAAAKSCGQPEAVRQMANLVEKQLNGES